MIEGLTARLMRLSRRLMCSASYLVLTGLAVVSGFPLFWLLVTSLKGRQQVFDGFWPKALQFDNYVHVWIGLRLAQAFANSLIVTGLTIGMVAVTATLAGYAFAKLEFPHRDVVFYAFLASMMIPSHAVLIPMFMYLKRIGMLDSLVGLSLSLTGASVSFAVFLMRAFFKTLPDDLGDAGRMDGCTEPGVFCHVYLPIARPGVATVLILQFVSTWNELMFSTTFITTPRLKTIQPVIYQAVGRYSVDYAVLSAGLIIGLLPILATYLLVQRQFVTGLTAGAFNG